MQQQQQQQQHQHQQQRRRRREDDGDADVQDGNDNNKTRRAGLTTQQWSMRFRITRRRGARLSTHMCDANIALQSPSAINARMCPTTTRNILASETATGVATQHRPFDQKANPGDDALPPKLLNTVAAQWICGKRGSGIGTEGSAMNGLNLLTWNIKSPSSGTSANAMEALMETLISRLTLPVLLKVPAPGAKSGAARRTAHVWWHNGRSHNPSNHQDIITRVHAPETSHSCAVQMLAGAMSDRQTTTPLYACAANDDSLVH
jgi:hypothetical protein